MIVPLLITAGVLGLLYTSRQTEHPIASDGPQRRPSGSGPGPGPAPTPPEPEPQPTPPGPTPFEPTSETAYVAVSGIGSARIYDRPNGRHIENAFNGDAITIYNDAARYEGWVRMMIYKPDIPFARRVDGYMPLENVSYARPS